MGHMLTLEVPDEIYNPLVKTAEQAGCAPEELVIQWLASAVQQFADDPLEQFIGAFDSGIPDWADQHDKYI